MEMSEKIVEQLPIIIIVLIGIIVFMFLLDSLTGGKLVRPIVCAILFWIPLGPLATAFTQGCAAIPA